MTVAITNIEQTTDELHGFGLLDYNINLVIDPGETKTVTFTADKKGVFPYYCTNFCSALHQEMQGYLIVKRAVEPARRTAGLLRLAVHAEDERHDASLERATASWSSRSTSRPRAAAPRRALSAARRLLPRRCGT